MHATNPFAAPESQEPGLAQQPASKPPWSPGAIGVMAFFFSFLSGGIMYALNWERLGRPEKKLPALIAVLVGFAVFMTVAFLIPDGSPLGRMLSLINTAVTIFLYSGQKESFAKSFAAHQKKASVKWPLLYSLGVLLLAFVLIVVWVMVTEDMQDSV